MRLKAGEPGNENFRAVLLDGKVVPIPYEANEEEGWVISWMPTLPDGRAQNGEEVIEDEAQMAGFELVKRKGDVKIIFWDDASLANRRAAT